MYPLTISILCLALAGFTSAQTTTISLYIPGADTQPLVGSVVASDATATTYVLECAPGTDASDCGFDGPFTLTEGPSTAVYTLSADSFTGYEDCSIAGTTSAVCIESYGGSSANFPGMSTETYSATDFSYMPVVITAGAVADGSASVSSPSVTASNTSPRSASAATKTSGTTRATGTTSKTSGASTNTLVGGATQTTTSTASSSTGGVSAVTGNARWVVGVAVALGMIR